MSPLRHLLTLLRPYRWWIVAGVLLGFATIGSSVGLMAVSAYLISKAAIAVDVTQLTLAIAGVRLFALARAALRYGERYVTHLATFRILTRLRVWFYEAIEPLAPARLQQERSGDLLARIMADMETLESFYVRVIVPPLVAVLVTGLACAILGWFDLVLAAALLAFLVLTGVVLPLASRWLSRQPAREAVAVRAELNAALVDQIQGTAELLAFGQERTHQAQIMNLSARLNQLQEQLAVVRGMGNGLAALFTGLAGMTVLMLAIPLVTSGQIDGVFLALIPLAAIASFEAVQPLGQAFQVLEASQAAGGRLLDLSRTPEYPSPSTQQPQVKAEGRPGPAVPQALPRPQFWASGDWAAPSLQVQSLSFGYGPNEPLALRNISLDVPPGGCVALVGPSGAGKSTLVNLLLRFWDYREGSIRLGGQELRDLQPDDARSLIGVVSQDTYLFNTTVLDNLLLANPEAGMEQVIAACRLAQIHDFIQGLPEGYDTLVGENGLLLSGGERQRLAIARVILKDAPILVLDEATAQLDPLTEADLWQALDQAMAGRTCLVISHSRASLAQVNQILKLENGRIVS